jgi:2-polyprenyl-3-methyl-5-hydroxy-6-metoxy-1,4-benzoquinol methylase
MDYMEVNKKWWNNIVSIHKNSELYNLPAFKKGKSSLQPIEVEEVGNVKSKTMLHLLCHFGMDSLSWARKGAVVTGVDISEESISLAKDLSNELQVPATFIASDVYKLSSKLHKKFDIVFASYGVLLWLSDIKKFARLVNHFLKPGGIFYIAEVHPFTNILNRGLKLDYNYFDKKPYKDDSPGTYADWNAKIKGLTYMWTYSFSDILNAFIEEGMKIEFVHEFPFTMYNQFPGYMKKNKKGQFVLKRKDIEIPLLFSLKARK